MYQELRGHAKEQRQTLVVEHDDPHDDGDGDGRGRGGWFRDFLTLHLALGCSCLQQPRLHERVVLSLL